MNEANRVNLIVAVYNKAMEEIIERRKTEWQTFLAANAIYGLALKGLHDFESMLTPFSAAIVTFSAGLFTYIWLIRVYGNSMRAHFSREIRNNIQRIDGVVNGLIPSTDRAGGFVYWNRRYLSWKRAKLEKDDKKGDRAWPLWGQRGICIVMSLYYLAFVAAVWFYRTDPRPAWITELRDCGQDQFRGLPLLILGCVIVFLPIGILILDKMITARPRDVLLFTMRSSYLDYLQSDRVEHLCPEFERNGVALSHNCTLSTAKNGRMWEIYDVDSGREYFLKRAKDGLNVYY